MTATLAMGCSTPEDAATMSVHHMPISHEPQTVQADQFIRSIEDAIKVSREHPDWLFRGHPKSIHNKRLLPTVFRGDFTEQFSQYPKPPGGIEPMLCAWFKSAAPSVYNACPANEDYVGWLSLMEHFRAPTRLLNWTESVLVALFFATEDDTDARPSSDDGQLIVMDGHQLTRSARRRYDPDRRGEWSVNDAVNKLAEQAQTDHRFRRRKCLIDSRLSQYPLPFQPSLSFPRIAGQKGWFTIQPTPSSRNKSFEVILGSARIKRLRISKKRKKLIRRELEQLGISHTTIYRDLESISRSLTSRLHRWFQHR